MANNGIKNATISNIIIWLVGGFISYFFAYLSVNLIDSNGQYVFFGPDSFYHARRILDAAGNLNNFYQYDIRTQSWISWPWLYDFLLATISTLSCQSSIKCSTASLIHIPPLITFINTALLLGIASKLSLSTLFKLLLILAYAFSPLIAALHYAGRIDHHMIEFSFILASLYLGLKYLEPDSTTIQATLFGLLLGVSTGIHNALFVLQLPLLIALFVGWHKKNPMPKHLMVFLLALLLSQLLILIPSVTFQKLWFSYYFHSWFHLYIVLCTTLILLFFSYRPHSMGNSITLYLLLCLLTIPILNQVIHGGSFVFGTLDFFDTIDETQSPLKNMTQSIKTYSYLFYLFPIFTLIYITKYFNIKKNTDLFFISFLFFGSILMLLQNRLYYFGIIFLFLPMLIIFNNISKQNPDYRVKIISLATVILLLSYQPVLSSLYIKKPLGGSYIYSIIQPAYTFLHKVCTNKNEVILADHNDGHFIAYHSSCSVIANNMLISNQDFENARKTQFLLSLSIEDFIAQNDTIKYLFIRRNDNIFEHTSSSIVKKENKGLRYELLIDNKQSPSLELIFEISDNNLPIPIIAQIYKVL